jgi:hypothetical protein
MLTYLADVTLLVIICSIPYLVSWLRLHNRSSKKGMYEMAKYTTGMPKNRTEF